MSGQVIRLGPGECADAETGARYYAALAFPGRDETPERQDAVAVLVSNYLHQAKRTDQSNASFLDTRLNVFAGLHVPRRKSKLRTVMCRLRDRCILARHLRPWVADVLGMPQTRPAGIKKFNQLGISQWVFDGDVDAANNFRKRAWRPALPVAHIAIACEFVLAPYGRERRNFPIGLADVGLIERIVTLAPHMENVVCSDPRFKVTPDKLLHLEWIA